MNPKRKQKLIIVLLIVFGSGATLALILQALQQNINLFFTPSQVVADEAPSNHSFRLGGMVQMQSIKRDQDDGLTVSFVIEDGQSTVLVRYTGILPDLFREGQGVVALGKLKSDVFQAEEILAKHDENYMPPEAAYAMEQAKIKKLSGQK